MSALSPTNTTTGMESKKDVRAQRSVSHAGFPSPNTSPVYQPPPPYPVEEEQQQHPNGHQVGMKNNKYNSRRSVSPGGSSGGEGSGSSSANNNNNSTRDRKFSSYATITAPNSANHTSSKPDQFSFHPLKSYKTGNVAAESNLSIMTEIGPVFTTDSPTKKLTNNNFLNGACYRYLGSKPIRASKSTLDLPNLTQQDEFGRDTEGEGSKSDQDERKKRHKSSTSSPSASPKSLKTSPPSFQSYIDIGQENLEADGGASSVPLEKKEKKRRSFKIKKGNKEKEGKAGAASGQGGSPTQQLSPSSVTSSLSPTSVKVSTGEIGPAIAVGLNIGSSIVTSNGIPISNDQLLVKDANVVPVSVSVLPMDPSDSSDAEAALESELSRKDLSAIVVPFLPIKEVIPECPVDHTKGKEMMNTLIPCNIDQLFTMLFTNSTFYLEFQTKRKTSDINQSDWQIGGDESQKTRQLTFTVVTGQTIGPSKAQVTETQTLLPASKPGLLYAIQSESVNAGIPYADCFAVNCHYCLTRLSDKESNMVVISKIHYKKSTWAKTFIEKNSMSALADYFKGLETALKEECAKINAGGITPTSPIVVSNLPRRRHPRKKCRAPDIPATAMNRPNLIESSMMHQGKRSTLPPNVSEAMTEASMDTGESSTVMKVILTVLGFLVLLNAFLYFKLSSLETAANLSVLYPPTIQFSGEAPQTHQEWLMLLQQQESLHRTEVHSWHEVLISAIKILHQAERDLESLKAHITTYGRGDVSIVTTPSPISASGVVDSGGPLHKSKGVEGSYKANVDNEGDDPSNNFETNEDDMFSSINKNDGDIERREMKGVEA